MAHTESIVLHICPEQKCTHCPRLTTVAILNDGLFAPVCPLHGYVEPHSPSYTTQAELERQFESVRRFVVWMFDERGQAAVISPVQNLLTIPGYRERAGQEGEDDRGFYAGHLAPTGEHREVSVIWSSQLNQFFLYQNGKELYDRLCSWAESERSA